MKALFEKCRKAFTGRSGVGAITTALIIVGVVLLNSVAYTLVNTYGWYLNANDEVDFSLSSTASEILKPVRDSGKRVTVYFCMPKDELSRHDTGKYLLGTAEELEKSFSDVFDLQYVNIITKRNQDNEYTDLSKYTKDEQGNELAVLKTSVIFVQGDNFRVVSSSMFSDFFTLDSQQTPIAYNGEEIFLAMALWVLSAEHPVAYFTASHSEVVDVAFTRLLAAAGYVIDTIDLRRDEIPEDCALLVISNPRLDFEKGREGSGVVTEMERLTAYADAGGDLYVCLDPYLKRELPILESFLSEYGVSVRRTEEDGKKVSHIVRDTASGITAGGLTMVGQLNADTDQAAQILDRINTYRDGGIFVSTAAALDVDSTKGAYPLVVTSPSSETIAEKTVVNKDGGYTVGAVGMRTAGEKTSSLFMTASLYLASSDALLTNSYANRELLYGLLECVYGTDMHMPYGARMILTDTTILEDLTRTEIRLYTVLALLPAVASAVVGLLILRRRRYR